MPLKNYLLDILFNIKMDGIKNNAKSKIANLILPVNTSMVAYIAVPSTILSF